MSRWSLLPVLMVAASLPACGGTRNPAAAEAVWSRDMGALRFASSIRGRDGGASALFGGRSVWVFGDTPLQREAVDGSTWRTATFTTTADVDPTDGLGPFIEPLDENGAPGQLIPFTLDEVGYNALRSPPNCSDDCEPKWVLWPGPLVTDPTTGRGLLFYEKIKDWVSAGTSVATWRTPDSPVQRVVVAPGSDEPTLLFPAGDAPMGQGATVLDGWLYAYGCTHIGFFEFPCIVGRAPVERALERTAWRFWDGLVWGTEAESAATVMLGNSIMSMQYNPMIGKLIMVYSAPDDTIVIRTADAPEGPWSDEQVVYHARPPEDPEGWIYDATVHPELTRDNGRTVYVSYSRQTGFLSSEMRLVELTLAPVVR